VIGRSQFEGDRGDEQPQQGGVVTLARFETAAVEVLVGFTGSMAESSEDPRAPAHLAGDEDAVWQGFTQSMGPARLGSPRISVASMTSPSV
jgi:hypothetical protein